MSSNSSSSCIITVHLGTPGVGVAPALWHTYAREHGVSLNRSGDDGGEVTQQQPLSVFNETSKGTYEPRAILVDDDNNSLQRSASKSGVGIQHFVRHESGGFHSRSHCLGRDDVVEVIEYVRRQLEVSSASQSNTIVQLVHSVEGGIGSGMGSRFLREMALQFPKVSVHTLTLWPAAPSSVVAPYNAALSIRDLAESANLVTLVDNVGAARVCKRFGFFDHDDNDLDFNASNEAFARVLSSQTVAHRIHNAALRSFETNITPYPRIHFAVASLGGSGVAQQQQQQRPAVARANGVHLCLKRAFDIHNTSLLSVLHDKTKANKNERSYLISSAVRLYDVREQNVVKVTRALNNIVHETSTPLATLDIIFPTHFDVQTVRRDACLYGENSGSTTGSSAVAIISGSFLSKPLALVEDRTTKLYAKRSFVHHYVGDGRSEGEISEAMEELFCLRRDYEEVSPYSGCCCGCGCGEEE
eukprot:PhM_4_TR14110/c1_g2_i2/m.43036/K07374/TUBA; tubulin alpha